MLKMKKMMIVITMILTICLLATMSFEVKATGASDNPIDISQDLDITGGGTSDNGDTANAEAANAIAANEAAANSQGSQIIQPTTNTETNSTNGNELPQTGVTEDITVMFFIIVCAVSAIYAYKKIRDYKI